MSIGAKYAPFGVRCCLLRGDYYFFLLYQTIVGAWPSDANSNTGLESFRTRVAAFMLKAVKEAKVHISWTEPNSAYEKALQDFVERVLTESLAGSR